METQTIAHTETQTKPEVRHLRGCNLYRARMNDIWNVGPHLYRVPSESDQSTVYIVCIRKGHEFCACPDFTHRAEEVEGLCCKHIYAAKNWKLHSGECADCKVRLLRWKLWTVGEEHLTFCEDDELCTECATTAGVR